MLICRRRVLERRRDLKPRVECKVASTERLVGGHVARRAVGAECRRGQPINGLKAESPQWRSQSEAEHDGDPRMGTKESSSQIEGLAYIASESRLWGPNGGQDLWWSMTSAGHARGLVRFLDFCPGDENGSGKQASNRPGALLCPSAKLSGKRFNSYKICWLVARQSETRPATIRPSLHGLGNCGRPWLLVFRSRVAQSRVLVLSTSTICQLSQSSGR